MLLVVSVVFLSFIFIHVQYAYGFGFGYIDTRCYQRNTSLLHGKWDDLIDEDEETPTTTFEGPKDMKYTEFNLSRQNKHFLALRHVGGVDIIKDIYVRDPNTSTFWFVGKIACISDVSIEQAIARQQSLICEHAARLRPLELYSAKERFELWYAPGDSEMDVAYNRPHIKFIKYDIEEELEELTSIRNTLVGFSGEIYENGEEGFRTWRTDDGLPLNSEIKQPDTN